jgi:hypothetical protein
MQDLDYYEEMTKTEKIVARYLNELNLKWVFESPIFVYDNEERPRLWTPDFYIPSLGLHIEVWNTEKSSSYRKTVYQKNGYPVIFLHTYKEEKQWKNYLLTEINRIAKSRYDKVNKLFLTRSLE